MVIAAASSGRVLLELGVVLLLLAVLGRLAARVGVPSVPLYLVAGLALGDGGLVPLDASADFLQIGADVGVVLLLLLLGLEYTPAELRSGLRSNWPSGVFDLTANFVPGVVAGWLLGWSLTASLLLGGVTYVSSSGIIAKQLVDLDRIGNRETPVVLSVLVMEDLAMAVYLPIVAVLLSGAGLVSGVAAVGVALAVVVAALALSHRVSPHLSRMLDAGTGETLLLSLLGTALLVAGLAEEVQVSAAVGAFLVGVMLSGRVAERGREALVPIRDVFGGLFFVFFGVKVDPATLPPVLAPALALALVTAATKGGTGWWSAKRAGVGVPGRVRAALSLVPRGEFSIVIAGLGVAAGLDAEGDGKLGAFAACYVLVLAVAGSLAMRFADDVAGRARTRQRLT